MSYKQIISVEGMMCCHCEAHMEKAFSELNAIKSVKADHEKKEVVIETVEPLTEETARKIVESQGKKFLGIKTL